MVTDATSAELVWKLCTIFPFTDFEDSHELTGNLLILGTPVPGLLRTQLSDLEFPPVTLILFFTSITSRSLGEVIFFDIGLN